jgi:hypothetical protein
VQHFPPCVVGNENTGYEEVMGKHGLGAMNENGELFANFCANYNLVIGGTIFPHKKCHLSTRLENRKPNRSQVFLVISNPDAFYFSTLQLFHKLM